MWEGTGTPYRDCVGSSNNLAQICPKPSTIGVTGKVFFVLLYLVPGLNPFEPRINCLYTPIPPPLTKQLFLDFRVNVVFS